jgi:hypothetical protein
MNVPPEITQKILNEQSNGNRIQNTGDIIKKLFGSWFLIQMES